jgi:initiation factor 1A
MVKSFGGNKSKRKGRKNFRTKTFSLDDLKASRDENQEYGHVTEKYGDGRYLIMCYDKVSRKAKVRGALRQKSRLEKGGLVLISTREFQDTHSDILYIYTDDDKEKLVNAKVICESFTKTGKLSNDEDDFQQEDEDETYMPDIKSYGSDVDVWDDEDDENTSSRPEKEKVDIKTKPKKDTSPDLEELCNDLELDIDDI